MDRRRTAIQDLDSVLKFLLSNTEGEDRLFGIKQDAQL
jgi:hypothetical protein